MLSSSFIKADQDLFAAYQTVYSNADIELWFDWNKRLDDTKWTENCFWVVDGDNTIGGIVINENVLMYPFLIAPFCDRRRYWQVVLDGISCGENGTIQINGALDCDADILLTFGCAISRSRQMMCRPTDTFASRDPEGFEMRAPCDRDLDELAEVCYKGYQNSIDAEVFGLSTREDTREDIRFYIDLYTRSQSLDMSVLAIDRTNQAVVGFCLAGIDPNVPNGFAGISDLTVLPEYRRKGIAEQMLLSSLTKAHAKSPLMRLCVTVGNSAENLYRRIGFIPGPRFTNFLKKNRT